MAGSGELSSLPDGDETSAESHGERRAEEESSGVETDDVVDLGDVVLRECNGVDVIEEVGEEHLERLGVSEEGEEVDEGDALLGKVGCEGTNLEAGQSTSTQRELCERDVRWRPMAFLRISTSLVGTVTCLGGSWRAAGVDICSEHSPRGVSERTSQSQHRRRSDSLPAPGD